MELELLKEVMPKRITVAMAAQIMDKPPMFIRMGLRNNKFPFGTALKFEKRWSYYINTARFIKYMEGADLDDCKKVDP